MISGLSTELKNGIAWWMDGIQDEGMSDTSRTPMWWVMSPRDIAALVAVIGVLCGLSWWFMQPPTSPPALVSSPQPLTVQVADTSSPTPRALASSPTPTPTAIAIHVVGAVNTPGVVTVPPGSRAEAAIIAAGGFTETADQRSINLAQLITDGQQLVVGAKGEVPPHAVSPSTVGAASGGGQHPAPSDGGIVHINSASAAELEQLPGVGPKTAAAIVTYRDEHGPFTSVDHLEAVPGIGQKTVDGLRERARP